MLTEKELAMLREIQSGSGRRDAPPCLDEKAELEYLLSEMIKMRASAVEAPPEIAWSFRAKYGYLRGRFNYIAEPYVVNLLAEISQLGADNDRLLSACVKANGDVCDILGPLLYGPATEEGVPWGEHTAASLTDEAAARLRRLEEERDALFAERFVLQKTDSVRLDTMLSLMKERDALQAFKDWVHNYLDAAGVPHHPPGTHGAHGCRIGDRMDWVMERANLVQTAKKES